jgi:hypothetical protein
MKSLPLFALLLLAASFARAQTTVTGTVADPNSNPYANGTASAASVVSSGQASTSTTPVATSGSGAFSMVLNAGTYLFTICAPPVQIGPTANPTPKQVCFSSGPIAVSGSSQDISAALNAVALILGPNLTKALTTGAVFPSSSPATLPSYTPLAPCTSGNTSSIFQRADSSYASLSFIDETTAGALPAPVGTFTYCNRVFFNDTSTPIFMKNALLSIYHTWGAGTTTTTAADDRALAIRIETPPSLSGGQINSRIQGIYGELGIKGSPTSFGGGPDQGQNGLRFVIDDEHTGTGANSLTTPSIGVTGNVTPNTGNGTYSSCGVCMIGVEGQITFINSSNQNGVVVAGVAANMSNGGGAPNVDAVDFYAPYSNSGTFANHWGTWYPTGYRTSDFVVVNDSVAPIYNGAALFTSGLSTSTGATITGNGSIAQTGSVSLTPLSSQNISAIGQGGTAGSTSYTYELCAIDGNNGAACGSTFTTGTGNATLSVSNFNVVTFFCMPGVTSYNVYRTASSGTPSSTGLIGNFAVAGHLNRGASVQCTFNDTGLAGDSTSPPANNATGSLQAKLISLGSGFTFATLPSASANPGMMAYITDSTSIGTEGQNCAGSSTNKALAFSNGSVWKCF